MTVAERLVKARGVESQRQVAEAIGITQAALCMYEKGKRVPQDKIKVKLAKYYRTTVQALFYSEDVT